MTLDKRPTLTPNRGERMVGGLIWAIDAVAREATVFAAIGFAVGGIDDLAIDGIYLAHRARRWLAGTRTPTLADVPAPSCPGRMAVFVPAWDEAAVIGAMLGAALARFDHSDYRIYVGTYPNDPSTIAAVAQVAKADDRVRLVIGARAGPTTKADCLNTLWRALRRDEAAEGFTTRAIVLHDAEDVVHPAELRLFDALIGGRAAVQLPVLPLIHPRSQLVSGHYADEFAETHGKQLVVRQLLGTALPLAGTGCALARGTLVELADARDGAPFDAASLTEDYELGLSMPGGPAMFARVRERPGGPLVAVRAYFPQTVPDAVRQKARWMIGISLAGWDRTGWSHAGDLCDHWMRMRDRRGPTALVVLAAAYVGLVSWGAAHAAHWLAGGEPAPPTPLVADLLIANAALLAWRLAVRAAFTGSAYGWREAAWSLPRALVGNGIALLAARRAIWRYAAMLAGRELAWDKTRHAFPDRLPGARDA